MKQHIIESYENSLEETRLTTNNARRIEFLNTTRILDELLDGKKKILDDLEEPYKTVFSLKVLHEVSYEKIARTYGKTESWARVTYHRARLKIVKELEKKQER